MVCCCSLAGTQACLNCSRYTGLFGTVPIQPMPEWRWERPVKRIIEKYGADGKLVERIIEE